MKIQHGFISSSSSVTRTYSYVASRKNVYDRTEIKTSSEINTGEQYSIVTQSHSNYNSLQTYSWNTYKSTCYERIEYFMEANEKLGEPYSKTGYYYQNLYNYSASVAREDIYNGFIDLVITFPCDIRLTGIEFLNPWVSERFDSSYSDYWKYLPSKFNIYKVNTDNYASDLNNEKATYENCVANYYTLSDNDGTTITNLRPIRYDKVNFDENMTLLGTYKDINWKNLSSYKCFFKYNSEDEISKNATINSSATGTATWKCKQLVIRIFETRIKLNHLNIQEKGETYTSIKKSVLEYILEKELSYGTTYAGYPPTLNQISQLYGLSGEISSDSVPPELTDSNWSFGSRYKRSYNKINELKFKSGIDYKLGGIQLLISPDIFSITEMKMYNYAGRDANKVYIGEYDPDSNDVVYYGAKNLKQSPYFDVDESVSKITWRHNFNIPSDYLEADIFIRFNMNYDTFKVGDVVTNIVNVQNAPLSIKLTNNTVSVSLINGIRICKSIHR